MTHTPGEWTVHEKALWEIHIMSTYGGPIAIINQNGLFTHQDQSVTGRSHDKMLQDARLIAAAPAMLEALKEFIQDYQEMGIGDSQTVSNAQSIIAQAEGKN